MKGSTLKNFKMIYDLVRQIPAGKVVTYGQISKRLKLNNPRLVGLALHNNPDPLTVPCHRVVSSKGMIAEHFAFGGAEAQKQLLKKESIILDGSHVDLKKYQFIF